MLYEVITMVKIFARLQQQGLQSRMLLQVHDELVFDVPENELKTMQALVKEEMEGAVALTVPLDVEIGSYNFV